MGETVKERRRQEALELAERYAEWLRQHFGARRVIPFGSLIGAGVWHSAADLDLAVGDAPGEFYKGCEWLAGQSQAAPTASP